MRLFPRHSALKPRYRSIRIRPKYAQLVITVQVHVIDNRQVKMRFPIDAVFLGQYSWDTIGRQEGSLPMETIETASSLLPVASPNSLTAVGENKALQGSVLVLI